MNKKEINLLRMKRQHLLQKANVEEYKELYRDLQPGLNVYWNGFGQPPTLSFRADFDDIEFNRERLRNRELLKVRLAGGNLGWIVQEDLELFAALYCKPLKEMSFIQSKIMELLVQLGPLNIQQMKEETGFLVKEITPALHKLQEAFLIYEDQYDGEWDRSWYLFAEMFPEMNFEKYTKQEAMKLVLQRFAYRQVWFDLNMAKSYYKFPAKELKASLETMVQEQELAEVEGGYMLVKDVNDGCISDTAADPYMKPCFVYPIHRNDFLYKSNEHWLKEWIKPMVEDLEYDHEPLQYLLIDGEFHGACVGHFRNGPYDLNDVVCDLEDALSRKEEILEAIREVNFGRTAERFMGK